MAKKKQEATLEKVDSDGEKPIKMTPMMQQYMDMRRGLPDDVLLLYRLGDFLRNVF